MVDDPEHLITTYYAALARGDVEAVLACFADDIELRIHISTDILPFGGVSVGREAAEERLRQSLRDWDCERAEMTVIDTDGPRTRATLAFALLHKASGCRLESKLHNQFVIADGKITSIDQWLDDDAVNAFVALAKEISEARLRNHDATIH